MEKYPVIHPEDVPLPEDYDLDKLPPLPDVWPPNPPLPPIDELSWEEAYNQLMEACQRPPHANAPCHFPAPKEEVQGLVPLSVLADIPLPADDEFAFDEEVVQPPVSLQSEASLDNQQVKIYLDFSPIGLPSLDNGDEQQALNTPTPDIPSSWRRPRRRRNKQRKGPYAPNEPQNKKKPDILNIQFLSLSEENKVDTANVTPLEVPTPQQHLGSNGPLRKTGKKRRGEHLALENSSGPKHQKLLHDLTVQPVNPTPMKKKRSRRNRRKRNYKWNSEALRLRKTVPHPALRNSSGAKHQQVKLYLDLSRIGLPSLDNGDEQQALNTPITVLPSSRRHPWRRRNKQRKGPCAPNEPQDKKKSDLLNIQFLSLSEENKVDTANLTPLEVPTPQQHPGSNGPLSKTVKKRRGEHLALENSSSAKHQKLLHNLTVQPVNPTPMKKKRSRRNRRKRNYDWNSEALRLRKTGKKRRGKHSALGNSSGAKHQQVKLYLDLSRISLSSLDNGDEQQALNTPITVLPSSRCRPWRRRNKQRKGPYEPVSKTEKKQRGEHPALENSSGAKHQKLLHDLTVQPVNPTPMKKKRSRRNRRKRNYKWNSEALRLHMTPRLMKKGPFFRVGNKIYPKLSDTFKC